MLMPLTFHAEGVSHRHNLSENAEEVSDRTGAAKPFCESAEEAVFIKALGSLPSWHGR